MLFNSHPCFYAYSVCNNSLPKLGYCFRREFVPLGKCVTIFFPGREVSIKMEMNVFG